MSANDKCAPGEVAKIDDWVVIRTPCRWSWARFEAGRVVKVGPKTLQVTIQRESRVDKFQVIAIAHDAERAQQLVQTLNGIRGEYERREWAAGRDYAERKTAAKEAAEKQVAALLSQPSKEGVA